MSSINDDACDCYIYRHRVFKYFYSFYERITLSEAMKSREWIISSTLEKRVETRVNIRTIDAILSSATNYSSIRRDNRDEKRVSRRDSSLFVSKNESLNSFIDRDIVKLDVSINLNIAKSTLSMKSSENAKFSSDSSDLYNAFSMLSTSDSSTRVSTSQIIEFVKSVAETISKIVRSFSRDSSLSDRFSLNWTRRTRSTFLRYRIYLERRSYIREKLTKKTKKE